MKFEISRLKFCEPYVLTPTGEVLPRGANKAPDARLDIRARGFWAREQSAFFDVRVCHPNADSYKNLTPGQIYKLEVERGTFTPLVFTTTGVMSDECQRYHSRLAELRNRSWLRFHYRMD